MSWYANAALAAVFLTTLATTFATFTDLVPAESLEHPTGVSLRDESVRSGNSGFFTGYAVGRAHGGGGLFGGK